MLYIGVVTVVTLLKKTHTLPKFNMDPKNDGFQVRNLLIPIWCHFQVNHVKLWEGLEDDFPENDGLEDDVPLLSWFTGEEPY